MRFQPSGYSDMAMTNTSTLPAQVVLSPGGAHSRPRPPAPPAPPAVGDEGETLNSDVKVHTGNLALAGGIIGGAILLGGIMTFVVTPWVVKGFYPEWSYPRRLAVGFGSTFLINALLRASRK